ncbi:MAG: metallophosphoesterase [Roseburia sp.]
MTAETFPEIRIGEKGAWNQGRFIRDDAFYCANLSGGGRTPWFCIECEFEGEKCGRTAAARHCYGKRAFGRSAGRCCVRYVPAAKTEAGKKSSQTAVICLEQTTTRIGEMQGSMHIQRIMEKRGKKQMKKMVAICMSLMLLGIALPLSAYAAEDAEFRIKIVHTNDMHARVLEKEEDGIIGIERLKYIIDAHTDGADLGLVLDSGDTFHGQSIGTLVQGESIARLLKACGYDAITAGNHDWSYGKDRLLALADLSGAKMLTGNVVDGDNNPFFPEEFYIREATEGLEASAESNTSLPPIYAATLALLVIGAGLVRRSKG